jgi:cytochrome b involved in lipid metabolism
MSQQNHQKQLHVCVNGNLYDLTDFSNRHPGGSLTAYHGQDATATFAMYHDPTFIERITSYRLGPCSQNQNRQPKQ